MKQFSLSGYPYFFSKPSIAKFGGYLFKLLLGLLLCYFLYRQLGGYSHLFNDLKAIIANWNAPKWIIIISVFLLCCFNWTTETYKWQFLMQKVLPISFGLALRSVLVGTSLAIVTPNRLGEYGGRVALLPSDKWAAMAVTFRSNFSQLIINLLTGAVAFGTYCVWAKPLNISPTYFSLLWTFIALISVVLLFFYYRATTVINFLQQFNYLKFYIKQYNNLQKYTFTELNIALILSFFRWIIFALQYVLLLWVFDIQANFFLLIAAIGTIYFVQTILPAITFIEIGVRGNTALFFLGAFSTQKTGILLASFGLWGINLLIPALLGTIIMVLHKKSKPNLPAVS